MTRLLNDDIVQQVRDLFNESLKEPVALIYFGTQQGDCMFCGETRQLLEEVSEISDKISLEIYDLDKDTEQVSKYKVDKAPAIVIAAKDGDTIKDYGIRYYGIPSGHEFSSLIQDILQVSERDSGLQPATREFLRSLTQPVHLQVFVTPTCPYCPRAVILTHRMAMESDMLTADMVESQEFYELANKYGVSGVPHTDINDGKGTVVGAVPEEHFVAEIRRALGL